jgi:hypothetical protein
MVVNLYFIQVTRHTVNVLFSTYDPVAKKCVVCHHAGNDDRPNQVALDRGVYIVRC